MDHDEGSLGEGDFADAGTEWDDDGQLALADDDEQLPWLEADDYEDEGGFDWRIVVYALFGLAVVALLLGAVWYFTRDKADPELMPDGSTIEAPEEAYKERPENPGGAEVAGTGDQAFEVAEGQSTRGIIGDEGEVRPSIDRDQGEDAPAPDASATATASGSEVYVQIGAFGSRADADAAWATATSRYPALSGMRHRVLEGEVNGATVFRLQAVAASRDAGEATCRSIRNAGGDCYIR
ncbi:hypothetical protein AAW00_11940 [Aurantiacibacter luteus]|uniref:SPOR domain-containing protein n=1 Tax=Aurantiacibacter luteus TaxID=1581420 RepID=A0A0G9MT96_9SPHN|nr:hypothetical protein AAW00_11940 [Aurantiacibacter luteus]